MKGQKDRILQILGVKKIEFGPKNGGQKGGAYP